MTGLGMINVGGELLGGKLPVAIVDPLPERPFRQEEVSLSAADSTAATPTGTRVRLPTTTRITLSRNPWHILPVRP